MDFFGDYSIESASCHPSSLSFNDCDDVFSSTYQPAPLLSPRDTRTSYPMALANMTALTREFGLQKLERSDSDETETNYALSPNARSVSPSPSHSRDAPSRSMPCWRRRMQRQSDMRLQCDPSHLRNISELVERMIDNEDQCGVSRPKRPSAVPSPVATSNEDNECDDSDPSTPRSLSSTSSDGGKLPSAFAFDSVSLSHTRSYEALRPARDGRVQKSRHRRSHTSDRR